MTKPPRKDEVRPAAAARTQALDPTHLTRCSKRWGPPASRAQQAAPLTTMTPNSGCAVMGPPPGAAAAAVSATDDRRMDRSCGRVGWAARAVSGAAARPPARCRGAGCRAEQPPHIHSRTAVKQRGGARGASAPAAPAWCPGPAAGRCCPARAPSAGSRRQAAGSSVRRRPQRHPAATPTPAGQAVTPHHTWPTPRHGGAHRGAQQRAGQGRHEAQHGDGLEASRHKGQDQGQAKAPGALHEAGAEVHEVAARKAR